MSDNNNLKQAEDAVAAEWSSVEKALNTARQCIHTKVKELVGSINDYETKLGDNYEPGVPVVYSRVKDMESCKERIAERYESLSKLPDLIGCRVVVIHSEEIGLVQGQLAVLFKLVGDIKPKIDEYDSGVGRAQGYAGTYYKIPLNGWIQEFLAVYPKFDGSSPNSAESSGPKLTAEQTEIVAKYGLELQIHTVMEEAWSRVSHAGFYKTSQGVPKEIRRDLLRLASTSRLLGDHMRNLSLSISLARKRLRTAFEDNHASTGLDEYLLWYCSTLTDYKRFLEDYRRLGNEAGFQESGWKELVHIGDETDICLEVCQRTNLRTWGDLDEVLFSFARSHCGDAAGAARDNKLKLLKQFVAVIDTKKGTQPFDRPLLVFSILRLLEYPVLPSIDTMDQTLWNYIGDARKAAALVVDGLPANHEAG
ncbi:hypothetical protein [Mycobacterium sp. 155]|uniref:hypothetical protein n=1 Tax=Mycobacterium sp. 155 TaxID=1157943 RepID=UPI0012F7BB40|nr:hypothetical protein [Mycobacterium sp. 155]